MDFKKSTSTYEDFLKLAQQITDGQYGEDNDYTSYKDVLDDFENLPVQPDIKLIDPQATSNLTKIKHDKLKEEIAKTSNITIGQFVIKIHRLQGAYERERSEKPDELNISIYEANKINKIHKKVQVHKDNRFKTVPWMLYFKDVTKAGQGIPTDTVVEIVRWLQIITKIGIFL